MNHLRLFAQNFDQAFTETLVRWRYVIFAMIAILVAVEWHQVKPPTDGVCVRTASGKCFDPDAFLAGKPQP